MFSKKCFLICAFTKFNTDHLGYEPADLTMQPPPLKKPVEGVLIFFVSVSSVPQKMSSKESLYFSELFRLIRGFRAYSFKLNFDKLNIIGYNE